MNQTQREKSLVGNWSQCTAKVGKAKNRMATDMIPEKERELNQSPMKVVISRAAHRKFQKEMSKDWQIKLQDLIKGKEINLPDELGIYCYFALADSKEQFTKVRIEELRKEFAVLLKFEMFEVKK